MRPLAASLRSGDWLLLGILLLTACEAPPPPRAEPDLATQAAQALDQGA